MKGSRAYKPWGCKSTIEWLLGTRLRENERRLKRSYKVVHQGETKTFMTF